MSIVDKMRKKKILSSVENIEKNLNDIAGVRVICSFPDDIYALAAMLVQQDDIRLIAKKDYIANPKPNGYRSLHLIVEVPIFLSNCKRYMRVEVQFRTIAMDFWASLSISLSIKRILTIRMILRRSWRRCQDYQQYGRSDAGNPQPDRTELRMESESVTGRSACGRPSRRTPAAFVCRDNALQDEFEKTIKNCKISIVRRKNFHARSCICREVRYNIL